jgi:hypothetical protein
MAKKSNNRGLGALADPLVADRIVDATRCGLPRASAAAKGGVHPRTLTGWLAKGDADADGVYPDTVHGRLALRVHEAEADWEQSQVDRIDAHARSGSSSAWQAAAFLLERRRADSWGRQSSSKLEVTGAGGGPVELADAKAKLLSGIDRLAE